MCAVAVQSYMGTENHKMIFRLCLEKMETKIELVNLDI